MTDKVFKKQLERFGIESIRVIDGVPQDKKIPIISDSAQHIVRAIMDSMEGRAWIYSKLIQCGVFEVPFVEGKPDVSAFLAGAQKIGHLLQAEVEMVAPEQCYLMKQEADAKAKAAV